MLILTSLNIKRTKANQFAETTPYKADRPALYGVLFIQKSILPFCAAERLGSMFSSLTQYMRQASDFHLCANQKALRSAQDYKHLGNIHFTYALFNSDIITIGFPLEVFI